MPIVAGEGVSIWGGETEGDGGEGTSRPVLG
jgi:hypothetical protein